MGKNRNSLRESNTGIRHQKQFGNKGWVVSKKFMSKVVKNKQSESQEDNCACINTTGFHMLVQ